jgi:hypothetical protein
VPTHAAIRQTFAVLGRRMREVLTYAFAGFQAGALPLPRRERDDTDDDDAPEPDPELLDLAMAARSFGSAAQPRKALR